MQETQAFQSDENESENVNYSYMLVYSYSKCGFLGQSTSAIF